MKKILGFIITLFFICSCGNINRIDFAKIDRVFIDYNPQEDNNFTSQIDARICIKMHLGKIIPIENRKAVETSDNVKLNFTQETISVIAAPRGFNDSLIVVDLKITNKKGEVFISQDTLRINFRAGINLNQASEKGSNGSNGKNGGTPLLFRSGKDGENGENGLQGRNGDDFALRIWKEDDNYRIEVRNQTNSTITNYRIAGTQPFSLNSSGSNGGNGGDGGDGGDGKGGVQKEDKTKKAGDGGNGGNGGHAGHGGGGGDIICTLHPNAIEFQNFIQIISRGGKSGNPGQGGNGGIAGKALAGQTQAQNGNPGNDGFFGGDGASGNTSIVIEQFDFN